jgi:hypothetical protein
MIMRSFNKHKLAVVGILLLLAALLAQDALAGEAGAAAGSPDSPAITPDEAKSDAAVFCSRNGERRVVWGGGWALLCPSLLCIHC